MDALPCSHRLMHSSRPIVSDSKASDTLLTSSNLLLRGSSIGASCFVSMGSKLSKSPSGFPNKAMRTGGSRRRPVSNVYDPRRAAESVIQEEAPQLLEIGPTLEVSPGKAFPLGATEAEIGINFSLFSQHASAVTLCLAIPQRGNSGKMEAGMVQLTLNPKINKTRNGLPRQGVLYGYRIDGPQGWEQGHRYDNKDVLLDPYAKLVEGRRYFGDVTHKMTKFLGKYDFASLPFDWGNDYEKPNIPEKDLVIYEMNIRAFTSDESSGLHPDIRGSYLGVVEKIPHLLELGINAVELLPVFEFDELEFQRRPNPRDHMINTWGYSTMNFFAPMSRYASAGGGPEAASLEFKQMVKALHAAGIEVILDVVYNHTNEADDLYPYATSFRGIDNKVYYMLDPNGQLLNFSGCVGDDPYAGASGSAPTAILPLFYGIEVGLGTRTPRVIEYHVDGFRFDLASVLCRGIDGSPLDSPPIIKAIAKDRVLSRCKLIAEPWDCDGLYLVGRFPNWDRWAEWNGRYRDDIRKFIKVGDLGMKGIFATRVSGSSDLYKVNKRKPCHNINFVIAHDGFTLNDLVSYNFKHNEANGEGGNDGSNDNFSWNCGHEGETTDSTIKALRARQMKNFHVALMTSQGTPMMLMGDEYGHTRYGNNNSYGHDTAINNFQWGQNDVTWHEDNWDNHESKFLAFTLHDHNLGEDIYLAFNAHDYIVKLALPAPPSQRRWSRVVDTNLESPHDFVPEGVLGIGSSYNMAPFSSILLLAKQ
ncbi:hypothetical protein Scep_016755 [Stephania cephalantha]|uniref:isoamylase n=1 Tax=Stephania cephalantha TaxID=152367 RepID=A0AAP0INE6_9MAGN